jgi:hypothetical protein
MEKSQKWRGFGRRITKIGLGMQNYPGWDAWLKAFEFNSITTI